MGGSPQSGVVCVGLGGAFCHPELCVLQMLGFVGWISWLCWVQLCLGVVSPKIRLSEHLMQVNKLGRDPALGVWFLQCIWLLSSAGPALPHGFGILPLAPGWPLEQRALLQQPHAFCLPSNPSPILAGSPFAARGILEVLGAGSGAAAAPRGVGFQEIRSFHSCQSQTHPCSGASQPSFL